MAEEKEVATVAVVMDLILLIVIGPLVQKVGKIEVMETLLKILNMKVAEVEEKGVYLMKVMIQKGIISNLILLA